MVAFDAFPLAVEDNSALTGARVDGDRKQSRD
jgi:hypothetical protein